MPDTLAQLLDDHLRRQQQAQQAQPNQALDDLIAPQGGVRPGEGNMAGVVVPNGVRGGEGPPGVAARGEGTGAPAFNTSMPSLDIWNGNAGTRSFASGVPSVALSAMRGGGIDPGYTPFSGAGPGSSGVNVSTGGGSNPTDIIDRLTNGAVNSIAGGRLNPNFENILGAFQNHLAPILGSQTAANRLGLDQLIQQGSTAANGARIPGAIENDATRAHAALLQAQNTPRAEDVVADQASERRIEQIRQQHGVSEETAAGMMRRSGERLPRRMGGTGPNTQSGSNANPPWIGGQPNAPAQTGLGSNGNPPLPVASEINPVSNQPAPPFGNAAGIIDKAFDLGNGVIPTTSTANGQQQRVPYNENPSAYNRAITQALENIPDDHLRQNFPEIQKRLLEQFGGTTGLDAFMNSSNNLLRNLSPTNRRQNVQVDRLLRMAGMQRSPDNPAATGGTPWQSWLSPFGTGINMIRGALSGQ